MVKIGREGRELWRRFAGDLSSTSPRVRETTRASRELTGGLLAAAWHETDGNVQAHVHAAMVGGDGWLG